MPNKPKKWSHLSAIEVTNSEWGQCAQVVDFLEFLHEESAPIPDTSDELDKLLTKWVLRTRKAGMDRLFAEGKISKAVHRKLTQ